MIKKTTQMFLASLQRTALVQPFSSHGPTPEKLQKVTDLTYLRINKESSSM